MIRYSEIFGSIQGEGEYTGRVTIFLRFWACNLSCFGFGQKEPTNPKTWLLPYEKLDFTQYGRLEDLPVFEVGCDSAYSWRKEFKRFRKVASVENVVDEMIKVGVEAFGLSPTHFSTHPVTGNPTMLCFTGGEPMLYQNEMIEVVNEFKRRGIEFDIITVETNGTKPALFDFPHEFVFSISPKLYHVTGEKNAVKPEVIDGILERHAGWVKIVVTEDEKCWEEVDDLLKKVKFRGNYYIMPCGATLEQQMGVSGIVEKGLKRGFKISARLQNYIFQNAIGK